MRKFVLTLVAAVVVMPALAQEEKAPQEAGPNVPVVAMQRDHEAFQKAHEEHWAQFKATKEKMEKLVKEYNKLKSGKKKDAKRAEIEKEVGSIYEKQLEFKKAQLAQFEERLARMKAEFEKENTAQGKQAWVNQKTEALIQADGDVKALFGPRPGHRPHRKFMGPQQGPRPDFDD